MGTGEASETGDHVKKSEAEQLQKDSASAPSSNPDLKDEASDNQNQPSERPKEQSTSEQKTEETKTPALEEEGTSNKGKPAESKSKKKSTTKKPDPKKADTKKSKKSSVIKNKMENEAESEAAQVVEAPVEAEEANKDPSINADAGEAETFVNGAEKPSVEEEPVQETLVEAPSETPALEAP